MTTGTGESSQEDGTIMNANDTNENSVDADADADATGAGATTSSSSSSSSSSDPEPIGKEDLIELIRAVKFKNPDFSQRQVYNEIVTEIPSRFPQYANSLSPETLGLNDVKKAWKKAILQQQQQQQQQHPSASNGNRNNPNADLAERLKAMTTNPKLYTIGLDHAASDGNHTAAAARAYVASFLEDERAENSARERELLEDYVHVFLDVPADTSVATKPHQALINFQTNKMAPATAAAKSSGGGSSNKKKKGGKKKAAAAAASDANRTAAAAAVAVAAAAPFEDAIVVKIQMAAPVDENDTARHPMLLYDKTRTYKTFVHPSGALTGATDDEGEDAKHDTTDGYSRLAHWIRNQGVRGALGTSGGTKAYFYGRLTQAANHKATNNNHKRILSIYVKELVPSVGHDF